jgi:hypothetical protein
MYGALAAVLPSAEFASQPSGGNEERFPSWAEEVLLPEQFFGPAANAAVGWAGERRLLFAILQDAVTEFRRYCTARHVRGRRLFRETREWFWSKDRSWLCSFEHICAHLDLDPDYIRRGLQRLHEAAAAPVAAVSPPRRRPEQTVRHLAAVRLGKTKGPAAAVPKRPQGKNTASWER